MERKKDSSSTYGMLAVIIVVICFLISWKMILPKYKSANQEYAQLKEDIDAASSKISSLETTRTQLADSKSTVDKILVAIPGDKDVPNLLSELEAIAAKNKVYIPSIQLPSEVNASTSSTTAVLGTNTVAFSATGGFTELSSFVSALESDLRFMNINTLAYSYSDKDKAMTLSVQLSISTRSKI